LSNPICCQIFCHFCSISAGLYGTGVFSPEFYLSFLFYSSWLGAIASLAVIYPSKNSLGFK